MIISYDTFFQADNKILTWQQQLSQSKITPKQLLTQLDLDINLKDELIASSSCFKLRVPQAFISRMQKGNIADPLLLQVLPVKQELEVTTGFSIDPLAEADYTPIKGLIHKYKNRVLLITTSSCAVNCRYCFRRHFPYAENRETQKERQQLIKYLNANLQITEVILSGGDPLVAPDAYLQNLVADISSIKHIKTLRIHTRLPIMIPARITQELIAVLTSSRLTPVMVIHCNHAQEIDQQVIKAMAKLRQAGIMLLNQAVLLRCVNDSVKNLYELSDKLFVNGVMPYYLHLLDAVQGARHFKVAENKAIELMQNLAKQASGYLVPRLVKEIPGEASKTRIF